MVMAEGTAVWREMMDHRLCACRHRIPSEKPGCRMKPQKNKKFMVDKVDWVVYNNTCVAKQRFENCG